MPSRNTLTPLALNDEENNVSAGSKVSRPLAPDRKLTGAGLPDAPGQQPPNHLSVYSNHLQNRHWAMSDLFPDIDTSSETESTLSLNQL